MSWRTTRVRISPLSSRAPGRRMYSAEPDGSRRAKRCRPPGSRGCRTAPRAGARCASTGRQSAASAVRAGILIRAGQAACRYSWMTPHGGPAAYDGVFDPARFEGARLGSQRSAGSARRVTLGNPAPVAHSPAGSGRRRRPNRFDWPGWWRLGDERACGSFRSTGPPTSSIVDSDPRKPPTTASQNPRVFP